MDNAVPMLFSASTTGFVKHETKHKKARETEVTSDESDPKNLFRIAFLILVGIALWYPPHHNAKQATAAHRPTK